MSAEFAAAPALSALIAQAFARHSTAAAVRITAQQPFGVLGVWGFRVFRASGFRVFVLPAPPRTHTMAAVPPCEAGCAPMCEACLPAPVSRPRTGGRGSSRRSSRPS